MSTDFLNTKRTAIYKIACAILTTSLSDTRRQTTNTSVRGM